MEERGPQRVTGRIPRPAVQETSDPDRKPLAQWVVSGKTVRPADEVYAEKPPGEPRSLPRGLFVLPALFVGGLAVILFLAKIGLLR